MTQLEPIKQLNPKVTTKTKEIDSTYFAIRRQQDWRRRDDGGRQAGGSGGWSCGQHDG